MASSQPASNRKSQKAPSLGPTSALAWVRYEPGTILNRAARVSPTAELAHRRLADLVWVEGAWPLASRRALASAARTPLRQWSSVARELSVLGWRRCGVHYVNPEVGLVRREAALAHEQRRAISRAASEARWSKAGREKSAPAGAMLKQSSSKAPAMLKQTSSNAGAMLNPCPVQYSTVSTVQAFNGERLTRTVLPREQGGTGEGQFLNELAAVVAIWKPGAASEELEQWGGWWRNRYREDSQKARKVLAEMRCMIRESKIIKSPGKAAFDLWARLPTVAQKAKTPPQT